MTPFLSVDARTAAAFRLVVGFERAAGLGTVFDVDPGSVPEDAWTLGGRYPWLATATPLQVRSTSAEDSPTGTGASRVSWATLDSQGVARAQVVTLNGITPVPLLINPYRVNMGIVVGMGSGLAVGATTSNVGDLILEDVSGGTVRGIIAAGVGITQQSCYTVPVGFSLGVYQIFLDVRSPSGTIGQVGRLMTYFKNPTGGSRLPLVFGNSSSGPYNHMIDPPLVITAGTDFSLLISEVSDNNSVVTAAWNGVLKAN